MSNQASQVEIARLRPVTDWQAESLRLTVFPVPGTRDPEPTWWADLVGNSPDARTLRPKVGEFHEEGLFKDRKLTLAIRPNRIDWLLTAPEPGNEGSDVRSEERRVGKECRL